VADRSETAGRDLGEMHFVVVGAYVADCFVTATRLPQWGEVYEAHSIRASPGGKGLNQAVALARLGAHVCAVGAVGDDGLGRDILSALTREGIETEFFVTRERSATSICICFVGDDGQASFVGHIDEDVAVTPEIVRGAESAVRRADAVLITFEAPVSTIREAITLAHRCDARVFLNPAPPLADPPTVATLPWPNVDVLVPNEAEARAILEGLGVSRQPVKIDDLASALACELGVPLVIVTLGESGCAVHSHGVTRRYSAQQTAPVDTTGASDAFTATLVASLAQGRPEMAAIKAATAAAAFSIGRHGGYESMPFRGCCAASFW
jgi:ribokinase